MTVERTTDTGFEIARRFQMRMIERAREGSFGSLRTRNAALQTAYAHVVSLLDNPEIPILIYGEKGSGKRRHVDEMLQMHNFHRKLEGRPAGKLKVFRGDFLSDGFARLFLSPATSDADVVYLEGVDLLGASCQAELLEILKQRKIFSDKGLPLPRLILGTEQALSVLMICGQFKRELFQAISGFAVFLPTLKERSEDIPFFVQAFSEEISGRAQTPPGWFVDFVGKQEWPGNIEDLQKVIRHGLSRQPELAKWTTHDLPANLQPRPTSQFVSEAADGGEARRLRDALDSSKGNRRAGAQMLGIAYPEFLQKMISLGVR